MQKHSIELISLEKFVFMWKEISWMDNLEKEMKLKWKNEYVIISLHSRVSSDNYFKKLEEFFNIDFGKIEWLNHTYNYRVISIKK